MKGEVVIPDGGISTIDVYTRVYKGEVNMYGSTDTFAARVYVEGYPACTVPLTHNSHTFQSNNERVSLGVRRALSRNGLIITGGVGLDMFCLANGIAINYHVFEVATQDEVREWGTPGWEDDIRWHKGHEMTYELTMTTRWPIDSKTTAMNVKLNEGNRTIEQGLLFCETCNAVVQGVTVERTEELDLIINQRGEDLAGTYKGATK